MSICGITLTPNNLANHQVKELSSYETRNFVALNIHEMEEIVCSLVQSQLQNLRVGISDSQYLSIYNL